jgi:cobalamin biosynthesis protein CobT
MAYGQRDKFLQAVVTFTISEQAKEMSAPDRQELLMKIRDKYTPDVSNAEWGEIAKGINDFKFIISDSVKYGEVPNIENQLPDKINYQETQSETPHLDKSMEHNKDEDIVDDVNEDDDSEDNSDLEDVEGVSDEDDFSEDEKPIEPEPKSEPPKVFGKFTKPKEVVQKKVSTQKLRGLLKPKK